MFLQSFYCTRDKNCSLVVDKGKKICRWCRFQRCLSVGMKPEMVERHVRYNGKPSLRHDKDKKTSKVFKSESVNNKPGKEEAKESLGSTAQGVMNEVSSFFLRQSLQLCHLTPSKTLQPNITWLRKSRSLQLQHFILQASSVPCKGYKMIVQLDNYSLERLLRLHPRFKKTISINVISNKYTSMEFESREGFKTFYVEQPQLPTFNVYVTTQSLRNSSIMIMESMNENLWLRLKDVINVSNIFYESSWIDMSLDSNMNNKLNPILILILSGDIKCKNISNGVESLSFFRDLSLEDQIIALKDSFGLIVLLLAAHVYDKASESFIIPAVKGNLSFCIHKNRYLTTDFGKPMHEFYCSFLDNFYDFLRKDIFIIVILSVLCVLQDRPGLSCSELLEQEQNLYLDLLDHYIKGKVMSDEWTLDRDIIWNHLDYIMKEVLRFEGLRRQYVREKNRPDRERVSSAIKHKE